MDWVTDKAEKVGDVIADGAHKLKCKAKAGWQRIERIVDDVSGALAWGGIIVGGIGLAIVSPALTVIGFGIGVVGGIGWLALRITRHIERTDPDFYNDPRLEDWAPQGIYH